MTNRWLFTKTVIRQSRSACRNLWQSTGPRPWAQTGPAPEHKVCSAKIKAKNLVEIRNALLAVSGEKLVDCNRADQPVIKRLYGDLINVRREPSSSALPGKGTLAVNATCPHKHFEIARAFLRVEKKSLQAGGKINWE